MVAIARFDRVQSLGTTQWSLKTRVFICLNIQLIFLVVQYILPLYLVRSCLKNPSHGSPCWKGRAQSLKILLVMIMQYLKQITVKIGLQRGVGSVKWSMSPYHCTQGSLPPFCGTGNHCRFIYRFILNSPRWMIATSCRSRRSLSSNCLPWNPSLYRQVPDCKAHAFPIVTWHRDKGLEFPWHSSWECLPACLPKVLSQRMEWEISRFVWRPEMMF